MSYGKVYPGTCLLLNRSSFKRSIRKSLSKKENRIELGLEKANKKARISRDEKRSENLILGSNTYSLFLIQDNKAQHASKSSSG